MQKATPTLVLFWRWKLIDSIEKQADRVGIGGEEVD